MDRLGRQAQRDRRRNLAIGGAVATALRQDRLLFAFQPVICAATGAVDYFECLLRMRNEEGRLVVGAEFVETVEELGLIGAVDRYVLAKALAELGTDPEVRLGFNISGLTATDRSWLRGGDAMLRNPPDLASRLVVEITETAALPDIEESARLRRRVAACRLPRCPRRFRRRPYLAAAPSNPGRRLDQDRRLLRAAISRLTRRSRVFLRHLIGLTRGFGFSTVAECVETAEEAALLRAEGIGYLQGYHFGLPTLERSWLADAADP